MLKKKIELLLIDCFDQRSDLFLIDFSVSESNEIKVTIDGDNGVKVEDCMFISRAIEGNFDREELDFSLEVASCGATSPLLIARQYSKHCGRILSVKTDNDFYEGRLTGTDDKSINLVWKERQPKPVSDCLEWRLGGRYWKNHGVMPFFDGSVPYVINNSDLILTLPSKTAKRIAKSENFKILELPLCLVNDY